MTDRNAYYQQIEERSQGHFKAEDLKAIGDERDRLELKHARTYERILSGEGTYLGSSRGNKAVWDPAGAQKSLEAAGNLARTEKYGRIAGPITIQAMNVDSAVKAQGQLTGGDLKDLSYYASYLRNEFAAATKVRSDVSFAGTWGNSKVTTDVNEYIGWLMQAAQQKSQGTTETP